MTEKMREILEKAISALRTTTAYQIRTRPADGSGGRCAFGVVAEAFGCPIRILHDKMAPSTRTNEWLAREIGRDETRVLWTNTYIRNDTGRTFTEIADALEELRFEATAAELEKLLAEELAEKPEAVLA